jgi:hypothetical protein
MKKSLILFVSIFVIVVATQNAKAQISATATAKTSATIITPISIEKAGDLEFGNVVPTSATGTVVIATDGTRTFTGGALAFANSTGSPAAAQFTVTGAIDATYSITLNNTSFTVTNGSETMLVDNIVTTPTPNGQLTGGSQTVSVGATLNVLANQAPGVYKNDDALRITVAYN